MSLHGDGINDELFFLLWAKDDLNYGPSINVPDTVIYKFGQPVAWYFTALDGKVRRKNKQNLTNVRIEEGFNKYVIAGDIVAYYISLPTGFDDEGSDSQTRIEYFDRAGLHDFLYNRWKESNGVLQRFVEPKGTHNSMIRAIWSPKVCLMERRANVRHIFDRRFGLYERAVTYEGQEFHSQVHPLRGNLLATRIQRVCEELVEHVAEVTFQKQCIGRIVLNFKVDAKDKLYLLWSSSIRLADPQHSSMHTDLAKKVRRNSLNIDAQLKLPQYIRLADKANHSIEQPAPIQYIDCISCGKKSAVDCFHELPYKTIMGHYENLIWLLTAQPGGGGGSNGKSAIEWPPDQRVVEAAGGVGFGCLTLPADDDEDDGGGGGGKKGKKGRGGRSLLLSVEDVAIPPVIRHLHPKLKLPAYRRYKKDPLFLYKHTLVCEDCYLAYAEFAHSSFNTNPLLTLSLANPALAHMLAPPRAAHTASAASSSSSTRHDGCKHPSTAAADTIMAMARKQTRSSSSVVRPSSYQTPSIGRPAIHAPALPQTIHNAREADTEYGQAINRAHHDHHPPAAAPPEVQALIKDREDAFFRDAYKSRELSKQHPLLHLITTHRKLADVNDITLGDAELAHLSRGRSLPRPLGEKFAPYGTELAWRGNSSSSSRARESRGGKAGGAAGASADGKGTVSSSSLSSGLASRAQASKASGLHKEFLMKTLMEVQQQLSSPGALTRSILESIAATPDHPPPSNNQPLATSASSSASDGGSGATPLLPIPPGSPTTAAPLTPARSPASPPSRASSAASSNRSDHSKSHTPTRAGKRASGARRKKRAHARPADTSGVAGDEDEEEEEGAAALPRVVFQEEAIVPLLLLDRRGESVTQRGAVQLSVTGYEEEASAGQQQAGSTTTQVLLSCVLSHDDDATPDMDPGRWKLVLGEAELGLPVGGLRPMAMADKSALVASVVHKAVRMGGEPGSRFVFLDKDTWRKEQQQAP